MRRNRDYMPSVHHAFTILTYLAEHRFGAELSDLMEETGLCRRQVYRHLVMLKNEGINIIGSWRGGPSKGRWRIGDRRRVAVLLNLEAL